MRGLRAAPGGVAVGPGAAVGSRVGALLGGVNVVTVSGGSGVRAVLGGVLGAAGLRGVVEITLRGVGAPTVALVVALSPLLMMTAVATAPTATTAPKKRAMGRQRRLAGQAHSSSS
ncbi:hypothetical protein Mkiyose1665_17320 [Mycobacterium kiyosense]|nr:hypothetical protein Mkiyose1665_17320 [Mycobacterium kiyosense]